MVDNNISFLDTNLMRLTMELVEWMELEMIEPYLFLGLADLAIPNYKAALQARLIKDGNGN